MISSGKRKISSDEMDENDMMITDKNSSDPSDPSDSIGDDCISVNSKFSIAIVGGGIAGLGAALALQQRGFQVKVYERDVLFEDRRQGYGLTLTNNPKGPLAELDLLDECIARDCPSNAHWIFAPTGNVLGYYGRSFKNKEEKSESSEQNNSIPGECQVEGRGNLRIPRQNLRRMMLERLQPNTVRWGMKLLDYTENQNGVKVQFQTSSSHKSHKNNCESGASEIAEDKGKDPLNAGIKEVDRQKINEDIINNLNNIEEIQADILVGADGIRSIVRQLRGKKVGVQGNNKLIVESSPLHYVGVAVILGITTATHPLINQQGFYCLDGTNRLFTMPFEDGDSKPFASSKEGSSRGFYSKECSSPEEGSTDADSSPGRSSNENKDNNDIADNKDNNENRYNSGVNNENNSENNGIENGKEKGKEGKEGKESKTKLTMWQLSFSDYTEEEGAYLRSAGPMELLNEALRRCKGWFEPVSDMIKCTPKGEVWGTGLYDRDPMPLRGKDQGSRVTVIGDACHPMSMFKGQGANQALHDGPLLASWLDSGGGAVSANKKSQKSEKSQKIQRIDSNGHINGNKRGDTQGGIQRDGDGERNENQFENQVQGLVQGPVQGSNKTERTVSTELTSQNIYTRLRCFEREMVARTSSKVLASREAATRLHSPAVLSDSFRVEGVKNEVMNSALLKKLEVMNIGAHLSCNLEGKLRNALVELQSDIIEIV